MLAAKRKILIVEDEFILYDELVDFFKDKGYEILGHADGHAVDSYDDAVHLLKDNEPDIAVLDIDIKGKKDGLELAAFIKEHFYTLIIILTGHGNDENLYRTRLLSPDGFVLKAEKPFDGKQLWGAINAKLLKLDAVTLRKNQGSFFRVREIDTKQIKEKQINSKDGFDILDIETFIKWENITSIVSYNTKMAGKGNNNILFNTTINNKGYVYRSSLDSVTGHLPYYFAQFDQSSIVNIHHITAKGRGQSLYFVGEASFKITDRYKDLALEKINMILGNKF